MLSCVILSSALAIGPATVCVAMVLPINGAMARRDTEFVSIVLEMTKIGCKMNYDGFTSLYCY